MNLSLLWTFISIQSTPWTRTSGNIFNGSSLPNLRRESTIRVCRHRTEAIPRTLILILTAHRGVDVLAATPRRLWDILQQDDDLASQIKNLRFLVLDEADRMIEMGHFAELNNILRLTMRTAQDEAIESEESETEEQDALANEDDSLATDMQTFVFSATLSKDISKNLKKRQRW
ncbi:hypothetical protein QCA50_020299 [Cerrena zonata]|uniref:ATP-dependent RNA helicase n=1 Tax=Cerrena zonata TaxID=2478898 RepID=A0AAW0F997_9APHY